MITTLKINVLDEGTKWMTFKNETEALNFIEDYENDEGHKDDIEALIDASEIKHYKDKYEEIYNLLFNSYSGENAKKIDKEDISYTVKYISKSGDILSISADSFEIAQEIAREMENSSVQILVNLSNVQDYKEKYDEFYNIMLNSYRKDKDNKVKVL